jgi:ABC-type transport system involved in cytochrome bd biosynthesis fused ATPase/permease subunit
LLLLEDVELHIPKGRLVALVGASGAGKSTLITTLVGLNKDASGNSEISGVKSGDLKGKVRRDTVGFICFTGKIVYGFKENTLPLAFQR